MALVRAAWGRWRAVDDEGSDYVPADPRLLERLASKGMVEKVMTAEGLWTGRWRLTDRGMRKVRE